MVVTVKRGLSIGSAMFALASAGCGDDSGQSGGGGGGNDKIDACAIVTQSDATALFGQPAEKDTGAPSVDPALRGECQWSWQDAQANSHTLQFRVWKGESYYSPGSKAEPFAIGDKGVVEADPVWGVDVQWVQGDSVGDLSYSTVGSVPDATTKVDAVKTLALSAASKLK